MNNKIFSLPYPYFLNKNKKFEEIINKYSEFISDIYVTCKIYPFTNDAFRVLKNIDVDIHEIIEIQNRLQIVFNLVFNDITVIPSRENMFEFIENFKEYYDLGVKSITIPFNTWVNNIKKEFPNLLVKSSVLNDISNVSEFIEAAKIGFDTITLNSNMIRRIKDIKTIKKIRDKYFSNIKIMIIVNEGCYGNCILKKEHRILTINNKSSYLKKGLFYCHIPNQEISSIFKKASIVPLKKEIDRYRKYIDVFKLAGRNSEIIFNESLNQVKNYSKKMEYLLEDLSITGENIPYIFKLLNIEDSILDTWLKKIENCNFNCNKCSICERLLSKEQEEILKRHINKANK